MAVLPFILARLAPAVADFDRKWFPNAWLHWLWFLGMVLLLFVCCEVALLVTAPLGRNVPPFVTFSKTNVILSGIIGVLIAPIAEEIFWRGYVVDQLRKFTRSAVAILIQSLLFLCCRILVTRTHAGPHFRLF